MIEATPTTNESLADNQNGNMSSLFTLLKSYKNLTTDSTKLVLADTRLAITSVIQIVLLGFIAVMVMFCLWLLILAGLGIWLFNSFAVTPAELIGVYFVLHAIFIILIALAIRSTNQGLRFTATRELIPRSKETGQEHA